MISNAASGLISGARHGIAGVALNSGASFVAGVSNLAGGIIQGNNGSGFNFDGFNALQLVTVYNQGSIIGHGVTGDGDGIDVDGLVAINNSGVIRSVNAFSAAGSSLTISGGQASVLGNLGGGAGLGNTLSIEPGAGQQFSYADSIANFASVEIKGGTVALSGVSSYTGSTIISGGTLVLASSNRLAAGSALELAGGTLQIDGASGVNGQSFASLSLSADSTLQLNGSALTFGKLGTIGSGAALTVLGYGGNAAPSASTGYALRLLGDYSADASFLKLLAATHINGGTAGSHFDGVYTDITAAVPEPQSYAMLLAGLGLTGLVTRRRQRRRPICQAS